MDAKFNAFADHRGKNPGRMRMVFFVDEARTLVDSGYYDPCRWVLDNVIQGAWLKSYLSKGPLPFMAMFLGTNSSVAHFLPPRDDSSHKYYHSFMKVPPPFTALDWDIFVSEPYRPPPSEVREPGPLRYNDLAGFSWLSRFGRPIWYARWRKCFKQHIKTVAAR